MGYYVETIDSSFKLKRENYEEAYKAACNLNARDELKTGERWPQREVKPPESASVASNPNVWFAWMPWDYDVLCKNIVEILEMVGFQVFEGAQGIDGLWYSAKSGAEEEFLSAVAPFVEPGSSLTWQGEDDSVFRYVFDGKGMEVAYGHDLEDAIACLPPIAESARGIEDAADAECENVRFDTLEGVKDALLSGKGLYNTETGEYFWLWNRWGSIAQTTVSFDDPVLSSAVGEPDFDMFEDVVSSIGYRGWIIDSPEYFAEFGYDPARVRHVKPNLNDLESDLREETFARIASEKGWGLATPERVREAYFKNALLSGKDLYNVETGEFWWLYNNDASIATTTIHLDDQNLLAVVDNPDFDLYEDIVGGLNYTGYITESPEWYAENGEEPPYPDNPTYDERDEVFARIASETGWGLASPDRIRAAVKALEGPKAEVGKGQEPLWKVAASPGDDYAKAALVAEGVSAFDASGDRHKNVQ